MSNRICRITLVAIIVLIITGGLLWWTVYRYGGAAPGTEPATNGSTAPADDVGQDMQTIILAGGNVALSYPVEFGLAISEEQMLVRPSIPPCRQGFDYCLYYYDNGYSDTNFESAGMRIKKRRDLAGVAQCLGAQPEGYTGLAPEVTTSANHSTSLFESIGDAGAGHTATGALYRLAHAEECYELETRIGTSQLANYPSGTIREFAESDRQALMDSLAAILDSIRLLPSGSEVVFPE